ncbi:MAG: MFS transporter [Azospirillum sp.]|nr:MFS transporter [Azospirillum sp.]
MTDRTAAAGVPAFAAFFSNAGHAYSHLLTMLYPTVVLALERSWGLTYGELITLMLAGQILFGAAALPSGWLGDRWSAVGMMTIFFLGTGAAAIATGLARTPLEIAFGLAAIGLFASIYHPVGMAWLVRMAENRGRALGVNGIYGAVGIALAPLVAAALTDLVSWRAAFIVPGASAVLFGLALWVAWRAGKVEDVAVDAKPMPEPAKGDVKRAFFLLSVTMTCVGFVGSTMSIVLPKLFEQRIDGLGEGTLGTGTMVAAVYLIAATGQYVGGRLADRFAMKRVYLTCYAVVTPCLFLAAALDSWALLAVAMAAVYLNIASLPSENAMLAHFTPANWRATAYGAKFVLALGVAAAAVPVAGWVQDSFGDFYWLFVAMGVAGSLVVLFGLALPSDRAAPKPALTPQPAE